MTQRKRLRCERALERKLSDAKEYAHKGKGVPLHLRTEIERLHAKLGISAERVNILGLTGGTIRYGA